MLERDSKQITTTVTPILTQRPVFDANGAAVLDKAGNLVTQSVGFLGVGPGSVRVRQ